MKKIAFLLGMTAILLSLSLTGCKDDPETKIIPLPPIDTGKLIILQAYSSSDSAGGASHSFVELYNSSTKAINLSGINLWYADGHRSTDAGYDGSSDNSWKKIELSGTIPSKASFLILGKRQNIRAAGTSGASTYQIPDGYGDINDPEFTLYNRAFKVALIKGDTNISGIQNPFNTDGNGTKVTGYLDMVGARNDPSDKIRGFEIAPARCSASEAVRRVDLMDTDDNSEDFVAARYNGMGLVELAQKAPRNLSAGAWNPFAAPGTYSPPPVVTPVIPDDSIMLMILQIGAATDGNISRSFVELYNNTNGSIVLNGNYSLQYAAGFSTGGTGGDPAAVSGVSDGPWKIINLVGTIPPYSSFLILGGADLEDRITPANTPIPVMEHPALAFDPSEGDMNIPTFYLSNRVVKVVLMNNQTLLANSLKNPFTNDGAGSPVAGYVDMIGVRNGNNDTILGFETALAPSFSKQVGVRRKNLTDTNNNSEDFIIITFNNLVTRTGNATSAISTYSADYQKFRPKNLAYGAWHPITGERYGN